jgi:hypothetical protein
MISDGLQIEIASRMLEVGEAAAAYCLAVTILHNVGNRLGDDARECWERAALVARRAMAHPPRTHRT